MQPMPLETERLSDLVAEKLVQYIINNNLQPGDRLPSEKEFAECYAIGRTTVREGISKLKSIGLVSTVQGYGCIINDTSLSGFLDSLKTSILTQFIKFSPEDNIDIFETRKLLETYALRTYLLSDEKIDLHPLHVSVRKMEKALMASDFQTFKQMDLLFHQQIVDLAKNNVISQTYSFIKDLFLYPIENEYSEDLLKQKQEEHMLVLDNLYKKDLAAVQILTNHINYIG